MSRNESYRIWEHHILRGPKLRARRSKSGALRWFILYGGVSYFLNGLAVSARLNESSCIVHEYDRRAPWSLRKIVRSIGTFTKIYMKGRPSD